MSTPRSRKIPAFLILGVWVAVVAAHVKREYYKPMALRLEEGARAIAPGSHTYAVRMGDRTIGMASTRLDTIPTGFVLEDMLSMDVPALGRMHRAVATTHIELGRALDLKRFSFALQSAVGRFEVTGHATPDSLLELEIRAGGAPERSRVRLDPDLTMDALLATRLAAAGQLEVGREVAGRLFDPAVMEVRETVVRVVARDTVLVPDSVSWDAETQRFVPARYDTIPAWQLDQRLGGLVVTSWVDEDGRLIRAESPLGMTLERTEFELARQGTARSSRRRRSRATSRSILSRRWTGCACGCGAWRWRGWTSRAGARRSRATRSQWSARRRSKPATRCRTRAAGRPPPSWARRR